MKKRLAFLALGSLLSVQLYAQDAKLGNNSVRLIVSKEGNHLVQDYQANKGGKWISLFSSATPEESKLKLYDQKINPGLRKLTNMVCTEVQKKSDSSIVLTGKDDNATYKQTITLDKSGYFRVNVTWSSIQINQRLSMRFPTLNGSWMPKPILFMLQSLNGEKRKS